MKMLSNQKGLGLLEVIIAAGLLSVVAYGIMQMTSLGFKSSADLDSRQEMRDLRDEFYLAIKSSGCGLVADGQTFQDADIGLDVTSASKINLSHLYSRYGQEFIAGQKYGTVAIKTTEPFIFAPPSKNSPFTEHLPVSAKTAGGYYSVGDGYLGEITINLSKSASAGQGVMPMRFLTLVEVDADKKISSCKSLAELSDAKEACNSMRSGDNKLEFEWSDADAKCLVTTLSESPSDGVMSFNEQGNASDDYVLSQIE